jgi:hypothetical protein
VFFRRLCKYEGAQMGCKEDNGMMVRILGNITMGIRSDGVRSTRCVAPWPLPLDYMG